MRSLSEPLTFRTGHVMRHRIALSPLTNQQSHSDGTASQADLSWFENLARGGFALLLTCAATVQASGQAFPNQLGIHHDKHLAGLSEIAQTAHKHGSLALVQIHHAGKHANRSLTGAPPVAPSDDSDYHARALETVEIEALRDDFIAAARRAQQAGMDGVELHATFGFILTAFLSPEQNRRTDAYGGDRESRAKLINEIADGIRDACGNEFIVGLRLSPRTSDRHVDDLVDTVGDLFARDAIDYLDLVVKEADVPIAFGRHTGRTLVDAFTSIPRGSALLGIAGGVTGTRRAQSLLEQGADFVLVGTAAILDTDFADRALNEPAFEAPVLPVSAQYLQEMGLSPAFQAYLAEYPGFVAQTS